MKALKSYVVLRSVISVTFLFCYSAAYHSAINDSNNNSGSNDIEPKESYRLPNGTLPLHYNLTITTNIHLDSDTDPAKFKFNGKEIIHLLATEDVNNEIVLHSHRLEIVECTLMTTSSSVIKWENETRPWVYDEVKQFLIFTIAADEQLVQGDEYYLEINFEGNLEDNNEGFYRSSYVNEDGKTVWLGTTQFAPTFARRAFPCYDEPGIRATMQLEINHHKSMDVVSNMPIAHSQHIDEDRIVTVFEPTPQMQTYLLAFLISNFKSVSKQVGDLTPQAVYARASAIQSRQCDFALDAGINTIAALEKYLNVSYPLPKLDQVALPDFGNSAMENFG